MLYANERMPLSERLTAYYRDVIAVHEDDPVLGACLMCRVTHCEDWRTASERLGHADKRPTWPVAVEAAHRGRRRWPV